MTSPSDRDGSGCIAVGAPYAASPGLTSREVASRRAAGLANIGVAAPSRTLAQIVRANVFTRFNALLGAMFIVIVIVGPLQDAMFGAVLVFNSAIGIVQEWRAKRTLDSLIVVTAPHVRVRRDGKLVSVEAGDVVVDDVLDLQAGDQLVVDGVVLTSQGLEIDESLLTGESEPTVRTAGDRVMSGSFVVAGVGSMQATDVGANAYGAALTAEARRFALVKSELRDGINRILRGVTWVILPVATLLAWSQFTHNNSVHDAIRGSVAGTVTMVPEGLVLLTSIAFAIGVTRLAHHRVVVRELAALEGLARVDVLCIDKTGTLTTGRLTLGSVQPVTGAAHDVGAALAAMSSCDPAPNATLAAIRDGINAEPSDWHAETTVAFSSVRKYSAADFGDKGIWVLGAPEILLTHASQSLADIAMSYVAGAVESGNRALLLGRAQRLPDVENLATVGQIEPAAVVMLRDELRPDAAQTLAYLTAEGVTVKVISGDHPQTVGTIADSLGLPRRGAPVDARELPSVDGHELRRALESNDIFGRVTPRQKQAMVQALRASAHTVAMTGDGVNDVLALKEADLGIAMGSGTDAARGVSQLVLVGDNFSAMPSVIAEGRRVIANVERVANLFVTKTVYATVLALVVGVARLPFPFLPRHLTLVSTLTIGIPGFFLALAPNTKRAQHGFSSRVLRFAVPAGLVAAGATFAAYSLARSEPSTTLQSARTVATLVLASVALWVLSILARPATRSRQWLIAAMVVLLVLTLALPWTRSFFALELPRPVLWLAGVGVAGLAGLALEGGWLAAGSVRVVTGKVAQYMPVRRPRVARPQRRR
ncbi:MAG TPA: HAD-IC family P-type ATPase [Acidothermaceae bacterium]